MYDASLPDLPVEVSPSQARRVAARRTSLSGDTLKLPSVVLGSNQIPQHPDLQPSITLTTPPRPDYPAFEDENVYLVPLSQDVQPVASITFTHIQPLQKRSDHLQPYSVSSSSSSSSDEDDTRPRYRSHQETYRGQNRLSDSFSNEKRDETSVVVRTATLIPSSPLLKSTIVDPAAPGARPYPQNDYLIQADPTSPYYTFQDTRLIPNPIIRIYLANSPDPKMFSLQNISPDTLGLLLSVFIQACELD